MELVSYKTITGQSEGLYKDKGSKFIAKAFYVENEDECKEYLSQVKKEYYDARHHCYAYRVNPENENFRSNDDGEPSGTAGKPILNQIYSAELFNVLVVVVRYFGGIKLGTSGLIAAYKTATQDAISSANIKTRFITRDIELNFEYLLMNDVMRIIKEENLKIIDQKFDLNCVIKLTVKKSKLDKVIIRLEKLRQLKFNVVNGK